MDLLLVPDNPTFAVDQTPFVCSEDEPWDGSAFLTYARRGGRWRMIPFEIRRLVPSADPDPVGELAEDVLSCAVEPRTTETETEAEREQNVSGEEEAYLEDIHPMPPDEKQRLFQTWFFFGLLSEFLGLNDPPLGHTRPVDRDEAKREIRALYKDCVVVGDDGGSYVTGAKILSMRTVVAARIRLQKEQGTDLQTRLAHLQTCLQFTQHMLGRSFGEVQQPIALSIAALGELFTSFVNSFLTLAGSGVSLPPLGVCWYHKPKSFAPESDFGVRMRQHGWCPSDVYRMYTLYNGLNTVNYLARLPKGGLRRDHSGCTAEMCRAGGIDLETYQPSHVREGCGCDLFHVDIDAVQRILSETKSFPILKLESSENGDGKVNVTVEQCAPEDKFIALSHVWADGLGNPRQNAIQECQIGFLAGLLNSLQDDPEPSMEEDANQPLSPVSNFKYKFWIDTLCCPVEINGKKIALERIRDVYRTAAHVLVLDSTLSCYRAADMSSMELLLRIFGSSAWMRRLWTLQEGALSRSLLFQFKDRAVNPFRLLTELFLMIASDTRVFHVYHDLLNEFLRIHGFFRHTHPSYSGIFSWPSADMTRLQWALMFRAVTVQADEALCIATLLDLDIKYILEVDDVDERMKRVWEMWARKNGGVPSRLVFSIEEGVRERGWGWAPRSLLTTNATEIGYPHIELEPADKLSRFDQKVDVSVNSRNVPLTLLGQPTERGLRMQAPGWIVSSLPRLPNMALHPWGKLMRGTMESYVPLLEENFDATTGAVVRRWFRVSDVYRSARISNWPAAKLAKYDREADWPLHRTIDAGPHALITLPEDDPDMIYDRRLALLVSIDQKEPETAETKPEENVLYARTARRVLFWQAPPGDPFPVMMDTVHEMADLLARDEVTKQLHDAGVAHGIQSNEHVAARGAFRQRATHVMNEAWEARPDFAQAVHDALGADMKEFMAATVTMWCSHDIMLQRLPVNQLWVVD